MVLPEVRTAVLGLRFGDFVEHVVKSLYRSDDVPRRSNSFQFLPKNVEFFTELRLVEREADTKLGKEFGRGDRLGVFEGDVSERLGRASANVVELVLVRESLRQGRDERDDSLGMRFCDTDEQFGGRQPDGSFVVLEEWSEGR